MANYQNDIALLVLDPKLEGYEISNLYQWEICVQLSTRGASINMPVSKFGNKVKHLLLKLEEICGKNAFTAHSKKEKRIQVETFPMTANEVKQLLTYIVKDRRSKKSHFVAHDEHGPVLHLSEQNFLVAIKESNLHHKNNL
eukprot:9637096-Ditylum_brightwellii.AAC.1